MYFTSIFYLMSFTMFLVQVHNEHVWRSIGVMQFISFNCLIIKLLIYNGFA